MGSVLRLIVVLLFSLGIILPKASAALAAALPKQVNQIVICTSFGLQTIEIDADGRPVSSTTRDSGPCVLTLVAPVAAPPPPFWQQLARQFALSVPRAQLSPAQTRFPQYHPARAPPLAPV